MTNLSKAPAAPPHISKISDDEVKNIVHERVNDSDQVKQHTSTLNHKTNPI